jgi:hypothetical protein
MKHVDDDPTPPDGAAGEEGPRPRLHARGVFYPGAGPGTTEFSGALFDAQGNVLARHCHAVLPFTIDPARRGRPPKEVRKALALLAAFDVDMQRQQAAGRRPKKALAYDSLGYKDDRSARFALQAAERQIDREFPAARWTLIYLPDGPMDYGALPLPAGAALSGVCVTGSGEPPKIGEHWTGVAVAVFVPAKFNPRNDPPVVRRISEMHLAE